MGKSLLVRSITIGFMLSIALFLVVKPQTINADSEKTAPALNSIKIVENGKLKYCKLVSNDVVKTVKMMVTAYSSTPDQTDDTPFITASGKTVADGVIANNMLPFGTRIKIPDIYGDKIFTVEDRMHKRKGNYQIDIWFSQHQEAKEFGAKVVNVEILES